MTKRTWIALAITLSIVCIAVWRIAYAPPFDPDKIGTSEARMWKAYYGGRYQELGRELIGTLQDQFDLSLSDSVEIAKDLAQAAMAFQSATGNYEAVALPGLERAYERIRELTKGGWSSREAARAELEWWVKRRTPGEDSPEQVGQSIAKLYAILYGGTNKHIEAAGLLRAQAANLRDNQGDWSKVESLLQQSYRELAKGVAEGA